MPLPNIIEFIGTNITQRKFQQAQEKLLNYLGVEVPTKTELNSEISKLNNAITPKADKIYVDSALSSFQNGALKTYPTLAEANADIANIALNTKVSVLSVENGGDYYKATAGATTLTKSAYDPLAQAKADASAKVSKLELDTLEALYGRYGFAKSIDNLGSATSSSSSTQAVLFWMSTIHNSSIAKNINGFFVAVKLDVSGATYPATNNDSAVFIDPLQVQIFEGSTKKGAYAFTRLGTTDVWYYKNKDLALSNITQIKIFAKPVAGVTITLSQASINVDGGFGNPEIAARNQAIQENELKVFKDRLLSNMQEDNQNNLLSSTTNTHATTARLYSPILTETHSKYSIACIIDTDGDYSTVNGSSSGFNAKFELTNNDALVQGSTVFLERIGNSKVWYAKDVIAKGDFNQVRLAVSKISGTYIKIDKAIVSPNSFPDNFYLKVDEKIPSDLNDLEGFVERVVDQQISDLKIESHPTTAFDAISRAATRRVDIVAFGDSNQHMDGYGFDFALRDALTARFGLYATPPLTGGAYGTQTGATDTQKSKALAGIPYNYVESGTVTGSGANGLFAGQSSENQLYKLNPSAKLRCHFAYSTFATGSGSFNVGARLEASPYTSLGSSGAITTNTGAETYQLSSFDVAAGDRSGKQLGLRFANVNQTLTGPFLSYFMRIEDVDKSNGICFSTIYGMGGRSLWDMVATLNGVDDIEDGVLKKKGYTKTELTNYFAEIRRLQLSKGQKPIIVNYINSGLNDQNELSQPSWGWRASTIGNSVEAYLDNLESWAKAISDIWQMNGWDETELFFWINPSHPTSTPDAAKLKSYRKAAFTFAGSRARVSVVDFENLTSHAEMLANGWYKSNGADVNHLTLAGYKALSQRIVDLIK